MTIPTQIRNPPSVSHAFLTFQIAARQSLAASATSGKLAATIRELQLIELIGGRRGVLFKSKVESIIFDSRSASLCSPGRLESQIPMNHAFCPQLAAATIIARPSDARGRLHVSRPLHAELSRPFYLSSLASCRTPLKHCGSPELEQHLLSRCTHSLSVVDSATICCVEEYVSSK